jgi:hypothetical protein
MEETVWHSGIMSSSEIGDKQGLATKWFGRDWDAPTFIVPQEPPGKLDEVMRNVRGEPLPREAFPEALYVFDRKRFEKLGDLFAAGGFYAAKGKLAQVLAQFDLGQGGLVPFPIYQEDKVTPVAGDFYIWSFGAQKRAFLPESSPKIRPAGLGGRSTSQWKVGFNVEDGDIALSAEIASAPPDVWCDPQLLWSLFFSDALVAAFLAAKIKTDFCLRRCKLV